MNYEEFLDYIQNSIQDFYGEEVRVTVNPVVKNNGIVLNGLAIMEEETNISPTVYLNNYYEDYLHGQSLPEIMKRIMKTYENAKTNQSFDMDFFMDFERVRSKLVYKLINKEKNKGLLEQIPHRTVLDLAIVYNCLLENDVMGSVTILINNQHLNMWNVDEKTLFTIAKENSERILGAEILGMNEILSEVMEKTIQTYGGEDNEKQEEWFDEVFDTEEEVPMYVLSNHFRTNGAACMLYPGVLKEFSRLRKKNLFVIPSSIHEVILVPADENIEGIKLYEMLNEVNETQVADEEILSGELYFYDMKNDRLEQVKHSEYGRERLSI